MLCYEVYEYTQLIVPPATYTALPCIEYGLLTRAAKEPPSVDVLNVDVHI